MTDKKQITCPTCGKANTWTAENTAKPFCSERCKLIDLGAWADEKFKVPGDPANPSELPDGGENEK
ncbi:MAG: DNA gyrase inhibitor YacG [Gammaproteobacteria bacterium]